MKEPQILYRYRFGSECDIKNLKEGNVWLSTLKEYNDPFENRIYIDFKAVADDLIHKDTELVEMMRLHHIDQNSPIYKQYLDFAISRGKKLLEELDMKRSRLFTACFDSLEEECTQLLGQANLTLAGFAKKNDLDYASYEKELKDAQNWYTYQKALLDILYKISDLRYTLHMGAVSRGQCVALLPTYTKQVEDTQTLLTGWHQALQLITSRVYVVISVPSSSFLRFSVTSYIALNLLTFFCEIAQAIVLPLGAFDFCFHTG